MPSLMSSKKRCRLKANRSHASRRTQQRPEKDLISEAKMRALKRGMEITPYKCIYQEGGSKGVMVYYRINFFRPEFDKTSWDREDVRALRGLELKQHLLSIGAYKPNMKSLVDGEERLFIKFCKQFKPSLCFLKSTRIGDTYEISYKVLEGIYRGYCGKRRWSDLVKSQINSNDIRILSSEQRLK